VPWGVLSAFYDDITGEYCNALGEYFLGWGIGGFDGHSYLPIAQTNNGWNSIIHVSNIDASSPAAARVSLIFYAADQQGWASSSWNGIVFDHFLDPGESWVLNMLEEGFPEEWIGSVKILSDYGVVANGSRVKPETDMLLTNTAAPSLLAITSIDGHDVPAGSVPSELLSLESGHGSGGIGIPGLFQMYGPLVFKEYNGWNTGIWVVNIAEVQNTVTISFYGPTGNMIHQDTLTISAQGMELIFVPSDPKLEHDRGFVGSVVATSPLPFHIAVDQVKYTSGEAMSYIATAAGAQAPQFKKRRGDNFTFSAVDRLEHLSALAPSLAMPLIQKGSPITGLGDTSGVQLFNIHGSESVKSDIQFYHHTGTLAQPTMAGPVSLELDPFQNMTLYTMTYNSMLQNFNGSLVVTPTGGKGAIVGVSNNVNYEVQNDGSVAFNMVNTWGQFRFGLSQTQLFDDSIELLPKEETLSAGDEHTVTATVRDQFGKPLLGVYMNFSVDFDGTPFPTWGDGLTDINGEVDFSFTNDTPGAVNVITARCRARF
jgi:hypothetical protein